jgi:hypothetical protein
VVQRQVSMLVGDVIRVCEASGHDVPVLDLVELTGAWIHGWTISRGMPPPTSIPGGFRVDVGHPDHPARYVLHTYNQQGLALLGRDLTAVGTEIKIIGDTASLRAALPEDWSIYARHDVMTVTLTRGAAEAPFPYATRIVADGAALIGLILDVEGEVASSARLAPSGRYGVIDRVRTRTTDQRRGLGRAVMTMLGNRALDMGMTIGLLSATADGRALYSALGWAGRCELAGAFRSK